MDGDWLTLEEAAAQLGVRLSTIKYLLSPARRMLVGIQAPAGPEYHGRRPWLKVTRASVEAYAARMATRAERMKEAQRRGYAAKAERLTGEVHCRLCTIIPEPMNPAIQTDQGVVCWLCYKDMLNAARRAINGRPLLKTRTVGPELDTWRAGRLVLER